MSTGFPIRRIAQRVVVGAGIAIAVLALVAFLLWRDRVSLADIPLPPAPEARDGGPGVDVTWFGVTTLLFDDGDTQLLIDGFVSRPSILDIVTESPVDNDIAMINRFLHDYQVDRLAAVIPAHSHFDHAMDVGAVANRTGAVVLGSASSAHIARGAGVPDEQIIVAEPGADYEFGQFTVRLIKSTHAPVGWNGSTPLPGEITSDLHSPVPVTAYREGDSYSIVVSHPDGVALVQGSGGIRPDALDSLTVDTVFLGVGLLESLGRDYIERYWQATVTATGARTVVPVHFDDYTQPFGVTRLAPRMLDDFSVTARILSELQRRWDTDTQICLPQFGAPMRLVMSQATET